MIDIDWEYYQGAIWRSYSQSWHPVQSVFTPDLKDLHHIESQKQTLLENTLAFAQGQPANHALLWGSRGTGKSSLVKSVIKSLTTQSVRIIQLHKKDLILLPDLTDALRTLPYKFIIFLDDLSFTHVDDEYQCLKSCIEGNIEAPADNVLLYVTTNKKQMISESMAENNLATVNYDTIRHSDITEDKLALADRFGLVLSFYAISQAEYFDIINKTLKIDIEAHTELRRKAIQFATQKGSRSARTAQQFCLTNNNKK